MVFIPPINTYKFCTGIDIHKTLLNVGLKGPKHYFHDLRDISKKE